MVAKATTGPLEPSFNQVTLRRDGLSPLRFNGEKIGSLSHTAPDPNANPLEEADVWETKARLFRTAGGKFVAGAEIYNRTKEQYEARAAVKADSLAELVEKVRQTSCLNDDELAELFQHTEVADSLVEKVE
jgi:hypothetical protein